MTSFTLNSFSEPCFELKGRGYTIITLLLLRDNLIEFEDQLIKTIIQAPIFFKDAPIIIELQNHTYPEFKIDFKELINIFRRYDLLIVAIKTSNTYFQKAARLAGLGILQKDITKELQAIDLLNPPSVSNHVINKVINEPVRSGQEIHASQGDLTIFAAVSAGAEVSAVGNIHIYGALRGRALAGSQGNQDAYIFCQSFEAELISIAGGYKISEDIKLEFWKKRVAIFIKKGCLEIQTF
ncbi:MAG: septum site-determining protein MinC [Francisellaceae bacterium]|nr:septum site-determining protein MinC [Francisellaceae bacterium]